MATWTHRDTINPTTNVETYTSNSFTPTQGDLLVVLPAIGATVAAGACTASANGITFTRITTVARGGIDTQYLFVADQLVPASPVAMTVTADVTGDAGTGCVMFVATLAGMTRVGAAAVLQFGGNNAASGTPAVTLSAACLTGNPVVAFMQNVTNPAAVTEPAGFTERGDTGYATPTKGAEYATANSGITATTITWGSVSATAWSVIVAEFDTSTAGTSGTLPAVTETDSAPTVAGAKADVLPTVTDNGSAQPLSGSKTGTLAAVSEADVALGLTGASGSSGLLPVASEADLAPGLTGAKTAGLATTAETDTSTSLTGSKVAALSTGSEADTSPPLVGAKVAPVTIPVESGAAQPWSGSKVGVLAAAVEADLAMPLTQPLPHVPDPYPTHHEWTEPARHAAYGDRPLAWIEPAHHITYREVA